MRQAQRTFERCADTTLTKTDKLMATMRSIEKAAISCQLSKTGNTWEDSPTVVMLCGKRKNTTRNQMAVSTAAGNATLLN
jgi:hypothetical protein